MKYVMGNLLFVVFVFFGFVDLLCVLFFYDLVRFIIIELSYGVFVFVKVSVLECGW